MKKSLLLILAALLIISAFIFVSGQSNLKQPMPTPGTSIPDTNEAKEIMRTIERAYDIQAEAAQSFDLKKFPTVFINDPRFSVSSSRLKMIKEVTNNPSLETAGYLDYKMAYSTWRNEGILRREALQKKAKAENRDLTREESLSLLDSKGRMVPARVNGPIKTHPLEFISITINDDTATTILDDGVAAFEMNLVLVDGKWYIAGVGKTFSIHP